VPGRDLDVSARPAGALCLQPLSSGHNDALRGRGLAPPDRGSGVAVVEVALLATFWPPQAVSRNDKTATRLSHPPHHPRLLIRTRTSSSRRRQLYESPRRAPVGAANEEVAPGAIKELQASGRGNSR
jgi:hypothetical protein